MATLTNASSVMEGGSIDFTLTLDAPASTATSYRWAVVFGSDAPVQIRDFGSENLGGNIVVAAGEREQTFTIPTRLNPANAGDRTFTVAILNSRNEEIVESGLITLEDTEGQASFSITSDNNVDIPLVGDVLTLSLDAVDPQGNINQYSYQWYDATDDTDIAGATGTRYTITDPGQVIGVRVTYTDRGGVDEVVTVELGSASVTPVVDPSDYVVVQESDGNGAETLAGTSSDEIIQGGNKGDVISTGGGDDIIIGGYGRDRITLDDGAETIVYRFASPVASDDKWTAVDGADTVRNFKRGVDKLVFVDVGETPVDLARFIALANALHGETRLEVELELIDNGNVLRGVKFKFSGNGFDDGPGSDDSSGKWLRIYFEETVTLFNPDGSITEEGIKLVGENGAGFNADTHLLTDFALLSEYFHDRFDVTTEGQLGTAITDVDPVYVIFGLELQDELGLIEASDLGVDII